MSGLYCTGWMVDRVSDEWLYCTGWMVVRVSDEWL